MSPSFGKLHLNIGVHDVHLFAAEFRTTNCHGCYEITRSLKRQVYKGSLGRGSAAGNLFRDMHAIVRRQVRDRPEVRGQTSASGH